MSAWRRLLSYLAPYRSSLARAILAMIVLALSTGLYPILLDLLTTFLVEGRNGASRVLERPLDALHRAASLLGLSFDVTSFRLFLESHFIALFFAVVTVKAASQAVRFYEMGMIAQRVVRDLRSDLFGATVRQSAGFFGEEATGFLVSRVVNDVSQVERAATYAVPVIVGDGLKALALAGVCAFQYPELSLVALIVAPIALLPIVRFGKMLKRYAHGVQEQLGRIANRVAETVGGIRVVHAYGRELHEQGRFDSESEAYLQAMRRSIVIRALQTPAMELIGAAALLGTLAYALARVDSGVIRPGEVVGFLLALLLLYEPVKSIGRLNSFIMPGLASAERVFEIVDRTPEVRERPGAVHLVLPPRLVSYERVSFRYREAGDLVLTDLSLELPKGKIIALAGPSGAGKSTVALLLPRFFDVTSGRIAIDGRDIRDLAIASLRSQIALVSQETYLFNDTIRANIAYGRPEAALEEIEEAARQAHAHAFIRALPDGYESRAGERGIQLSGGQRQRIAIARAFLRNAPILILDEATSALDSESEREVQEALDALLEDRTALVIAHRLSTIRRADEIIVLDNGRIVERGSHRDLVSNDATYARLLRAGEEVGRAS